MKTIQTPMHMSSTSKKSYHPNVNEVIKSVTNDKYCVHLFSGCSKIGKIRVDLNNLAATHNQNVYDFVQEYKLPDNEYSILLMEPDFHLKRSDLKLHPYGISDRYHGNILAHHLIYQFLDRNNFNEILLLSYSSPNFKNYQEVSYWRIKRQGWVYNKTLTWYKRRPNFTDSESGRCIH